MVAFNDIPSDVRIPGSFIEFDNRLAGNATILFKEAIFGQRLATGTVAANTPVRVTTKEQAEEYFGRGSMLAELIGSLKKAHKFMDTWVIAQDDDPEGSEAVTPILITGSAVTAGTLAIYFAGKRVRVGIAKGDTADEVAINLVAAIMADSTLPVSAVVNVGTSNQVDITCKWKGETGNDIDIRLNFYGETTPEGISVDITPMSGGTANPDLTGSIAALGDDWYNWIINPYTDAANLALLDAELKDRFGPMRQIGGRAISAFRGNLAETGSFGSGRNNEHSIFMGTNDVPEPPYIWAGILGIIAGKHLAIDPARPLQTLSLPGLKAPERTKRWSDEERNLLLFDGISTYTVAQDGTIQIERVITSYQTNKAGFADDSYLNINTPETLERFRYRQRALFAQKYPRHKLAEDDARVSSNQAVMQPKIARIELLDLYLELEELGWVQDYEGYKETLVVEIDPDDGDRLNIYDSPKLVGQLRVVAGHSEFRK